MNAFSVILNLNGQTVSQEDLNQIHFKSPHWSADAELCLADGPVGISCVQRFISDHETSTPFRHASGHILVGDIFLTYREDLADLLQLPLTTSDCELVMEAYLRFGNECLNMLTGVFGFLIYNPQQQSVFVATDHHGFVPCFYHITPDRVIISNTMVAFRHFYPNLSVNETFLKGFLTDSIHTYETCYQHVLKVPASYFLTVIGQESTLHQYYEFKKYRLDFKSTQDCDEQFRQCFEKAVRQYLPHDRPICAHISGGLDSTSVACMAAHILKDRPIYGFTSIPKGLEGMSRKGWRYHDKDIIEHVLTQYPSIQPYYHETDPTVDFSRHFLEVYRFSDQPIRNFFNLNWIISSFLYASRHDSRRILCGTFGNGTISWVGKRFIHKIRYVLSRFKNMCQPFSLFGYLRPLLKWRFLLPFYFISCRRQLYFPVRRLLFSSPFLNPRVSSSYPFHLWFGVTMHDPTSDIRLVEFCYSVPEHYYYSRSSGNRVLGYRLLVRRALEGIVPKEVRLNTTRGEQSADWRTHFNSFSSHFFVSVKQAMSRFSFFRKALSDEVVYKLFHKNPDDHSPLPGKVSINLVISMALFLITISGFSDEKNK